MPHRMDLEKPYQDAAAREERFQEKKAAKYEALWEELRDEVVAEKFIDDHFEDPNGLFANIIAEIAKCRETQKKRGGGYVGDLALRDLYIKIELRLEKYVDTVAETRAENDTEW